MLKPILIGSAAEAGRNGHSTANTASQAARPVRTSFFKSA
jgi:hypothetical protein